jgi:hypothetical protein
VGKRATAEGADEEAMKAGVGEALADFGDDGGWDAEAESAERKVDEIGAAEDLGRAVAIARARQQGVMALDHVLDDPI